MLDCIIDTVEHSSTLLATEPPKKKLCSSLLGYKPRLPGISPQSPSSPSVQLSKYISLINQDDFDPETSCSSDLSSPGSSASLRHQLPLSEYFRRGESLWDHIVLKRATCYSKHWCFYVIIACSLIVHCRCGHTVTCGVVMRWQVMLLWLSNDFVLANGYDAGARYLLLSESLRW